MNEYRCRNHLLKLLLNSFILVNGVFAICHWNSESLSAIVHEIQIFPVLAAISGCRFLQSPWDKLFDLALVIFVML